MMSEQPFVSVSGDEAGDEEQTERRCFGKRCGDMEHDKEWEKQCEKRCEERCDKGCKKGCKRFCCVLPLVVLGLLVWRVFAVARARYQSSYPRECFVHGHHHHHHDHDDEMAELPVLRTEALDTAELAAVCEVQLTDICGADAPLTGTLASTLAWQACVAERFYQLDAPCREALDSARLFETALFPDVLRDRGMLHDAAHMCHKEVHDHCRSAAQYFDHHNLCQVYEIALCLQSVDAADVSEDCRAAVDAFGLVAPADYDAETFSLQKPEHRRFGVGPWGGLMVFVACVLATKTGFKCVKRARKCREDKKREHAVQSEDLSDMPAKVDV